MYIDVYIAFPECGLKEKVLCFVVGAGRFERPTPCAQVAIAQVVYEAITPPYKWPWESSWWKPSEDPIRNLEKAGALIAAEIDRLLTLKESQCQVAVDTAASAPDPKIQNQMAHYEAAKRAALAGTWRTDQKALEAFDYLQEIGVNGDEAREYLLSLDIQESGEAE